jgi:hypothetical protein
MGIKKTLSNLVPNRNKNRAFSMPSSPFVFPSPPTATGSGERPVSGPNPKTLASMRSNAPMDPKVTQAIKFHQNKLNNLRDSDESMAKKNGRQSSGMNPEYEKIQKQIDYLNNSRGKVGY